MEIFERVVFVLIICFSLVLLFGSGKGCGVGIKWENHGDKRIRRYKECQGDEQCIKVLDSIYIRSVDNRTYDEKLIDAAKKACNGELKYYRDGRGDPEFQCKSGEKGAIEVKNLDEK